MIINRKELEKFHGSPAQLVISALEIALSSVDPAALIRQAVKLDGKGLSVRDIHGNVTRLRGFDNAYVVGAGKAAAAMADALCYILKGRITDGAITIPYNIKVRNKIVSVTEASHPVPDRSGVQGSKKILQVLEKAGQGDLVFVLISGGGSALMPLPASGISLQDKQRISSSLLRSGASIHEINIVRKHLSSIKGGQLLRSIDRSAAVVSIARAARRWNRCRNGRGRLSYSVRRTSACVN